jgi:hypothetical protein
VCIDYDTEKKEGEKLEIYTGDISLGYREPV